MTPEERSQKRLKKAARWLMSVFIYFCISTAMLSLLNDWAEKSNVYYFVGELTGIALVLIWAELKTREED
jgi:hypothetical protein